MKKKSIKMPKLAKMKDKIDEKKKSMARKKMKKEC